MASGGLALLVATATMAAPLDLPTCLSELELTLDDALVWEGRARSGHLALRGCQEDLRLRAEVPPPPHPPCPDCRNPASPSSLSAWYVGLLVIVGVTGAATGALIAAAAMAFSGG